MELYRSYYYRAVFFLLSKFSLFFHSFRHDFDISATTNLEISTIFCYVRTGGKLAYPASCLQHRRSYGHCRTTETDEQDSRLAPFLPILSPLQFRHERMQPQRLYWIVWKELLG